MSTLSFRIAFLVVLACAGAHQSARADDPLGSWNNGATKVAIIEFVTRVTQDGGRDFVAPADRIAVFDNDGTLWSETPIYVQLAFALDRVKALAPEHPEWQQEEPFKSALAKDMDGLARTGEEGLMKIMAATHAGMTTDEFAKIVNAWIAAAHHPRFDRPYTQLVYQPMLELLHYLRANGFKTYIVSGGGIEFMRAWVEQAYGVPPEQVIGSTIKLRYEVIDGVPSLLREAGIDFVDDKAGKPVGIFRALGKRPIAAFGNSDGDYQMIEWVTAREGPSLGMFVHHTDADREYAYDRESHIGRLMKGLDDAAARRWLIIDMKRDWARIFPE
jgi:phosphoserine phosphatase